MTENVQNQQPDGTEQPAAPTPAAPTKIEQNGVTRPKAGTVVAQVWDAADAISSKHQKPAERKEVLAACKDMNPATVATQYGKWRKFNGLKGSLKTDEVKAAEQAAKEAEKAAAKAKKEEEKAAKAKAKADEKAAKEAAKKAAAATPASTEQPAASAPAPDVTVEQAAAA